MANFLKRIGQWFIGRSEKLEQLDAEIKTVITAQTTRAFTWGLGLGMLVMLIVFKCWG